MDAFCVAHQGWPIMNTRKFPMINFRLAAWIAGLVFAANWAILLWVRDDDLRAILINNSAFVAGVFLIIVMIYVARVTSQKQLPIAKSWFLWMIGSFCIPIANITWAVLEEVLHLTPFPSLADFFYLLFYLFTCIGLVIYPTDELWEGERKFVILDNIIVVLGAGLSFWYLLVEPVLKMGGTHLFTALLAIAYPILDLIMLWTILIFFRNRPRQSSRLPLLLVGASMLMGIISDILFAIQSISGTYQEGTITQVGWLAGALLFALAGIQQVNLVLASGKEPGEQKHLSRAGSFSNWPVYLPYVWLAIAYSILIISFPMESDRLPFYISIGVIIALVIFRQVLTLKENERLYLNAHQELSERKQAQEALHQANLSLDRRVKERTSDLQIANSQLADSLHEKEILLKEIHHRVKNNLQIISSLLNLQTQVVDDPGARSALRDSQMRVRSMALIHEKLYQSENLSLIDLGSYIRSLSNNLLQSYRKETGSIDLLIHAEEIVTGIDNVVPIGLILNELISNSLKHAFPDEQDGEIEIVLQRAPGENVLLRYSDTGIGLPEDFDIQSSQSLGMRLVFSLARQLNGEIKLVNQAGVKFELCFPIEAANEPVTSPTSAVATG
jgi:two-component sensor histidine kinase